MFFKRTFGRFLLALLVITGLAGTLTDNTLTKDERKNAVTLLKETRGKVSAAANGLSAKQLDWKPSPGSWSINECLAHIALTENVLWQQLETGLKARPNPDFRDSIRLKDAEIQPMMTDRTTKRSASEALLPQNAPWKTAAAAINEFKKQRSDHIRYVRNTTEDLRNHVLHIPGGAYIDAYQMILLMNGHAERHYKQIEAIRAEPGFPKS
ncbi:MAG: DinB family protein [Chitinophagaceae bacterium]|nr:MAG: DinB family protein [Chitinophagaceae bacterium]